MALEREGREGREGGEAREGGEGAGTAQLRRGSSEVQTGQPVTRDRRAGERAPMDRWRGSLRRL